jgi:hypothetical protein
LKRKKIHQKPRKFKKWKNWLKLVFGIWTAPHYHLHVSVPLRIWKIEFINFKPMSHTNSNSKWKESYFCSKNFIEQIGVQQRNCVFRILKFDISVNSHTKLQIWKGSGSFYQKVILPNVFDRTPFDRNTICPNTVWPNTIGPNAVWLKHHLTESPFNRTPFDRKFILPKGHMTIFFFFFFRKWSFDRIYFRQKMSFDRKKAQKVVWPKKNCSEGRLTENSFDRK